MRPAQRVVDSGKTGLVLTDPTTGDLPRSYQSELEDWTLGDSSGATSTGRRQHPIDELLAEHDLTRGVLASIQSEAVRLAKGKEMCPGFWADAVDFMGNFGLLCHWRKKANHLYPALANTPVARALQGLDLEQTRDINLTLDLVDAVQDGDWEGVLRLAALYIGSKRRHLEREELTVLLPARDLLSDGAIHKLQREFAEVESAALGAAGRRTYLELAQKLMRDAKLPLMRAGKLSAA